MTKKMKLLNEGFTCSYKAEHTIYTSLDEAVMQSRREQGTCSTVDVCVCVCMWTRWLFPEVREILKFVCILNIYHKKRFIKKTASERSCQQLIFIAFFYGISHKKVQRL